MECLRPLVALSGCSWPLYATNSQKKTIFSQGWILAVRILAASPNSDFNFTVDFGRISPPVVFQGKLPVRHSPPSNLTSVLLSPDHSEQNCDGGWENRCDTVFWGGL